jgi:hypothetical protein
MLQNISNGRLGAASIVAGVLYFLASALYGRNFVVTVGQNAILAVAALLSLIALTGLLRSQNPAWVGLSRIGLIIVRLSTILAFLSNAWGALVLGLSGNLASGAFMVSLALEYLLSGLGYLGMAVGFIVLGAGILRTRLLPAWLGITLMILPIFYLLSSWFESSRIDTVLRLGSVSHASQLAFAIPWLALGIYLVKANAGHRTT